MSNRHCWKTEKEAEAESVYIDAGLVHGRRGAASGRGGRGARGRAVHGPAAGQPGQQPGPISRPSSRPRPAPSPPSQPVTAWPACWPIHAGRSSLAAAYKCPSARRAADQTSKLDVISAPGSNITHMAALLATLHHAPCPNRASSRSTSNAYWYKCHESAILSTSCMPLLGPVLSRNSAMR
jgi:hypothetical protein